MQPSTRFFGVVLTAAALVLTACGGQTPAQPAPQQPAAQQPPAQQPAAKPVAPSQRLSIATGGTGGVYYPYGGGLAKVLSKALPGVEATAEVTAGSVENMNRINQKEADIAFTLADTADEAARGKGKFKGPVPIRTLAALYPNVNHIVVLADSGINSVKDLKGKKVSTGAPNSGTEIIAERVLKANGIDPAKEISRERLSVAESVAAIKDKKIDAFFWSGGLPTAGVLELAATPGVKIKLLNDADVVAQLNKEYGPLYVEATVPANTYPNTPEAKVSAVMNLLVVHKDMSEDLAYQITRTLFEQRAELGAVHPEAKKLDPKYGASGSPVEYHPGAIKYYKEKGVWTGK